MPRKHRLSVILILVLFLGIVQSTLAETAYTVKPGDTLYKIAAQHGTSVAAIMAINTIANPNLIYVGQIIRIPGGTAPPANPPPPAGGATYVVQPGDTLYRIALRHGVTVAALVAANQIQNSNLITVGQVLVIPGGTGTTSPPTAVPPAPPANPPPTQPPPPVSGAAWLQNGSFEGGWYHLHGVPELQIPESWGFEWDEGPTGFGSAPWDVWVRPEVRVLPAHYLPPQEHGLFIFDGNQTVKVFKGSGAISYRLFQEVALTPGTYTLEVGLFPDLVLDYVNGQKIWATDASAGEVRFIVGSGGSGWLSPAAGQKNVMQHMFIVSAPQTVRVGLAVRGRYALDNNGWFLDGWSLSRH